jgi:uncharacterized membrane protein
MDVKKPLTYEEIKKKVKWEARNINDVQRKKLSRLDTLAAWITEHVGTMGFFFIIFGWTLIWLGWNTLAPKEWRFDSYPAFVLWLFLSNVIQIFLMPLIMVGQNVLSDHAELRAEQDFEVNKKAELEVETILLHLEQQNELMLQILHKLDIAEKK